MDLSLLSCRDYKPLVKINGLFMRFIREEQTEELAILAVKQNGLSLQYIDLQTEELPILAVKQNPNSLQYVKNQTE